MMILLEKFDSEDMKCQDYLSKFNIKDRFNLKALALQDKINFISYCLDDESLNNPNIIINLSFLIRQFNDLTTDIFEREDIYYSSIIELLDIKQALRDKLDVLRRKIVEYYFSITKSISTLNDEMSIDMENIYYNLFQCLSINDISVMMQKVDLSFDKIQLVRNSKLLLKRMIKNSEL